MNCDGLDTFRRLIAILNAVDGRWRIAWKIEHGVENNIIRPFIPSALVQLFSNTSSINLVNRKLSILILSQILLQLFHFLCGSSKFLSNSKLSDSLNSNKNFHEIIYKKIFFASILAKYHQLYYPRACYSTSTPLHHLFTVASRSCQNRCPFPFKRVERKSVGRPSTLSNRQLSASRMTSRA